MYSAASPAAGALEGCDSVTAGSTVTTKIGTQRASGPAALAERDGSIVSSVAGASKGTPSEWPESSRARNSATSPGSPHKRKRNGLRASAPKFVAATPLRTSVNSSAPALIWEISLALFFVPARREERRMVKTHLSDEQRSWGEKER